MKTYVFSHANILMIFAANIVGIENIWLKVFAFTWLVTDVLLTNLTLMKNFLQLTLDVIQMSLDRKSMQKSAQYSLKSWSPANISLMEASGHALYLFVRWCK